MADPAADAYAEVVEEMGIGPDRAFDEDVFLAWQQRFTEKMAGQVSAMLPEGMRFEWK